MLSNLYPQETQNTDFINLGENKNLILILVINNSNSYFFELYIIYTIKYIYMVYFYGYIVSILMRYMRFFDLDMQ